MDEWIIGSIWVKMLTEPIDPRYWIQVAKSMSYKYATNYSPPKITWSYSFGSPMKVNLSFLLPENLHNSLGWNSISFFLAHQKLALCSTYKYVRIKQRAPYVKVFILFMIRQLQWLTSSLYSYFEKWNFI